MERMLLSPEEVARFSSEGYLECGSIARPEKIAQLRGYLEDWLSVLPPDVRPEYMHKSHAAHAEDPRLLNFCRLPKILDLVECILGPNIILFGSRFFVKPAFDGFAIPWHQDGRYWPLSPLRALTIWLAIDNCDSRNGCMNVIPGSHRSGSLRHRVVDDPTRYVLSREVDCDVPGQPIAVTLNSGECTLHDPLLVHCSPPNTSSRRRAGFAIRYIPTSVNFDFTFWPDHPLWLVRGIDEYGLSTSDDST